MSEPEDNQNHVLPAGTYRVMDGELFRVVDGVPEKWQTPTTPNQAEQCPQWPRFYVNGILYQSGPDGVLSPLSGPQKCPRCNGLTLSFDPRAGCMLCLMIGCRHHESVIIDRRDFLDVVKENLELKRELARHHAAHCREGERAKAVPEHSDPCPHCGSRLRDGRLKAALPYTQLCGLCGTEWARGRCEKRYPSSSANGGHRWFHDNPCTCPKEIG